MDHGRGVLPSSGARDASYMKVLALVMVENKENLTKYDSYGAYRMIHLRKLNPHTYAGGVLPRKVQLLLSMLSTF
jgi:hypothetical protein